ncbi:PilN domain-containing protein [Marichromatium gracile]|uniref:PilN domain-containing protein n=1 Tax=Marichromatium gracile TaxID=1048 RepID=UPI001F328326|nr:PilN domain-containing protein [Marichromatium gracile]MCF1182409.1 PilN domain-containing protein [Marichromatium gracile]
MPRINLLPWREEARQRRKKELAIAAGAALGATLVLAVLVHLHYNGRIAYQESRNQLLQQEIAQLQRKIREIDRLEQTKADLLARMEVIQNLQQSRPEIVHLFEELVVTIPEGVYLNRLEQKGRSVVVEGRAQSNARVSAFMSSIESSDWVGNPRLMLIENKDKTGTGLSHFRLSFDQVRPGGEDEDQPA